MDVDAPATYIYFYRQKTWSYLSTKTALCNIFVNFFSLRFMTSSHLRCRLNSNQLLS